MKQDGMMPKIIYLGDYAQIPNVDPNKDLNNYDDGEITEKIYHTRPDRVVSLFTNMRAKYDDIANTATELRNYIDRINIILNRKKVSTWVKKKKYCFREKKQILEQILFLLKKDSANIKYYDENNKQNWLENYLSKYKKE